MIRVIGNTTRRSTWLATRGLASTNIQLPGPSRSVSEGQNTGNPGQSSDQTTSPGASSSSSHAIIASPPPISHSGESQAHPFAGAKEYAENQELLQTANPKNTHRDGAGQSNLPALPQTPVQDASRVTAYATPPFDTHHFYSELERSFSSDVAKSLMRATRALLVDRIGRVRREALSSKDLENQAYLFKAALSEARNEITLRQRNESASVRTALTSLRRDIDSLDVKMKSEIANLKHELQMDLDNRKTESRTELKQMDIDIEDALHKAIVSIGDMRATNEEIKWKNMSRAVIALGVFAVSTVVVFELSHRPKPKPIVTPSPPPLPPNEAIEGIEQQMT